MCSQLQFNIEKLNLHVDERSYFVLLEVVERGLAYDQTQRIIKSELFSRCGLVVAATNTEGQNLISAFFRAESA